MTYLRVTALFLLMTFVAVPLSLAGQNTSQNKGKKSYAFQGVVEKVDARSKRLTVKGEEVKGWMIAMTMDYKVDREDVLKDLKSGDRIQATVYEGDVMTLYNVQRAAGAEPAK